MNDTHKLLETKVFLDECKSVENLAKVAAKIAYCNFQWQFATLVLINSTFLCGVNSFMNSYRKSMVIINDLPILTRKKITKQFAIFGYNLENIRLLLKWIVKHELDNTGKFLIICQSHRIRECDEKEAMQILWEHRVLNVVFMNLSHQGTGYSYDIGQLCKGGPPDEVKNWNACFYSGKLCGNKFPTKLQNFKGCPITVSTFIQEPFMHLNNGVPSGADGDLLLVLITALNASLILKTPWKGDGWGNLDKNGSWVGSLGDVYYNLANFSMTSASITNTRSKDFQMSSFYHHLRLVWVTHPPVKEAPTYKLIRPFKPYSRTALIIFFTLFFLVVLILKAILKIMNIEGMPNNILLYSVEMCMGQPVEIRRMKTKVLSLISIWILYCFLIRTFYQVCLIGSLKTDVYLNNFNTIEDAIREKYNFGGGIAVNDYYADDPEIYNNWKEVNSPEYFPLMYNLTQGKKFVLAINLPTAIFFLRQPGRMLRILPQNIITSPTVLFFKRYSSLVTPINRIFSHLVESGIPQKIFKNATTTKFVYKQFKNDKFKDAIKLEDCIGCFVIISVGWLVSFAVLIAEICFKKLKKCFKI